MESGNPKLILGIVAAVVVVGGLVAVRTLTSPGESSDTVEIVEEREDESTDSSVSSAGDSNSPSTRVTSRGSNTSRNRAPGSGRTFERGEGAAALDVTPATTTTAQALAAAAATPTPETTGPALAIEDQRAIADLAAQFLQETDPEARIDIADELGLIDDPAAIAKIIELLRQENDPTVQAALLEAMQGLDALEMTSPEVLQSVRDIYARSSDPDVRIAAQDLLSDLATPEATAFLMDVYQNAQTTPDERLNASEALMRAYATEPSLLSQQQVSAITEQLKQDYQTGGDAAYRSQAVMALAVDGRNNLPFFQQALQTEQDPQLRTLLERLVRIFSQTAPAAPPAGTSVTPVPQP